MIDEKHRRMIFDAWQRLDKRVQEQGLPENTDAVRLDLYIHTPHGWEQSVSSGIVPLVEGTKFDLSGDEVKG